jgi:hypothetical protein
VFPFQVQLDARGDQDGHARRCAENVGHYIYALQQMLIVVDDQQHLLLA